MAYVDGELSEAERARVEEALGLDHDFRAELEALSRAGHLVDDALRNIRQEVQANALPQEGADHGSVAESGAPAATAKREPPAVVSGVVVETDGSASGDPAPDGAGDGQAGEPAEIDVADALIDHIEKKPTAGATLAAPSTVEQTAAAVRKPPRSASRGWHGLWLVVALAAAVYGGYLYSQTQFTLSSGSVVSDRSLAQLGLGDIAAASPLLQALETVPANARYVVGDGRGETVLPLLSLQTSDGRYCRQFEIRSAALISVALACRADDGGWRVEMLQGVAAEDGFQPSPSRYAETQRGVFDQLWGGRSLSAEEEQALIARAWR